MDDDRPEYLGVKTGLLGGKLTLIPADLARADDERRQIEVSASRDHVKDAPSLGSNEEITAERERIVRDHFGMDSDETSDEQRKEEGDTSGLSPGYRQDSEEGQDTRASDRESGPYSERQSEGSAAEEREPWADSDDDSTESAGAAAAGQESGDRGESGDTRGTYEGHQERSGISDTRSASETMRVSVWREKARAEKVLGDDGNEEVRIRKEWVEEE